MTDRFTRKVMELKEEFMKNPKKMSWSDWRFKLDSIQDFALCAGYRECDKNNGEEIIPENETADFYEFLWTVEREMMSIYQSGFLK